MCILQAGDGIAVSGTGAPASPWLISGTPSSAGTISVVDTATVDLHTTGRGSLADPLVIEARAIIGALLEFISSDEIAFATTGIGAEGIPLQVTADIPRIDLAATPPTGQVLTWNGTEYVPGPPNTVAPGVITPGFGLSGDGSAGSPLRLDVCTYDQLKAACAP